jgi:hypothetical protein
MRTTFITVQIDDQMVVAYKMRRFNEIHLKVLVDTQNYAHKPRWLGESIFPSSAALPAANIRENRRFCRILQVERNELRERTDSASEAESS